MATLTVWKFGSPEDAERALGTLRELQAEQLTPGTSALFVMTSDAVLDKVLERFPAGDRPELIRTNLSGEDEQKLREAFAE